MNKIISYLKLTRPGNNLIVALSVLMGALVTKELIPWSKVILACLSASFISGGGNAINDYFDIQIDKINKPQRPLPKGEISSKNALWFSLLLFFIGIFLSILIRPMALILAVFAVLGLIFYSAYLKKRFFWGNFLVSLICGLAFIYGGITTQDFRLSLIPAIFAFLFHWGREIIKDIQDLRGDLVYQAETFPIKLGIKPSLIFTTFIFSLLILFTFLPYLLGIFSWLYLIVVVLGVDLVLIYVLFSSWRDSSFKNLGRLSFILKIDMLLGLAAIYVGSLKPV